MKVKFKTLAEVQKFVKVAESLPVSVTLKSTNYVINGKSLLGVLSLDLENEIELHVDGNDYSKFEEFKV